MLPRPSFMSAEIHKQVHYVGAYQPDNPTLSTFLRHIVGTTQTISNTEVYSKLIKFEMSTHTDTTSLYTSFVFTRRVVQFILEILQKCNVRPIYMWTLWALGTEWLDLVSVHVRRQKEYKHLESTATGILDWASIERKLISIKKFLELDTLFK